MSDPFELSPEQKAYRERHQELFDDGARLAFLGEAKGVREKGGYPAGFHALPLDARNAWWAGYNKGRCDLSMRGARGDDR